MKTTTWNLKIENRRYEIKFVSSQLSGGIFVNGHKIGDPQSKWYSFYRSEYTFSLNDKEIVFLRHGGECDLIIDGKFVNHQTEAKAKTNIDLFTWIGILIGLCCLLILPVFHFQPISCVVSLIFTAVNILHSFSPFYAGWKRLPRNLIYTAVAFGAAYLAALL